jgi:hypothetical protein
MGDMHMVDLIASHWNTLRESPLQTSALGRVQARAAWRAAAAAYEQCEPLPRPAVREDPAATVRDAPLSARHPG